MLQLGGMVGLGKRAGESERIGKFAEAAQELGTLESFLQRLQDW